LCIDIGEKKTSRKELTTAPAILIFQAQSVSILWLNPAQFITAQSGSIYCNIRTNCMASPSCYTCQTLLPTLQCCFCHKRYCDEDCSPTSIKGRRFAEDFICGSGCSSAFFAGLMEHKASTPHRCPFENCSKAYALQKQLNVHIKAVHQRVRHGPCPCCGITFAAKSCLVTHLKAMRQQVTRELAEHVNVPAIPGDAPNRNAA
jgi:hypothetical protein